MVKIATSAAMRQYIPRRPRAEGPHGSSGSNAVIVATLIEIFLYSYFQSGSSGCLRSQSGRRLFTDGITAKIYAGGGELVVHSRVQACQGPFRTILPLKEDQMRFAAKTNVPAAG